MTRCHSGTVTGSFQLRRDRATLMLACLSGSLCRSEMAGGKRPTMARNQNLGSIHQPLVLESSDSMAAGEMQLLDDISIRWHAKKKRKKRR